MEVPHFDRDTTIGQMQDFQRRYDVGYWEHTKTELQDIRHVEHHIGKMLGKIATFTEAREHGTPYPAIQIEEEVIPDLLFWALHLANSRQLNVEEIYRKRIEANIQRLHPGDLTPTT